MNNSSLLCIILYSWEYSHLQYGIFFEKETLINAEALDVVCENTTAADIEQIIEGIKDKARRIANELNGTVEYIRLDDKALVAAEWDIGALGLPEDAALLEFAAVAAHEQAVPSVAPVDRGADGALALSKKLPPGFKSGGCELDPDAYPDYAMIRSTRTDKVIWGSRHEYLAKELLQKLTELPVNWNLADPFAPENRPHPEAGEMFRHLLAVYDAREMELLLNPAAKDSDKRTELPRPRMSSDMGLRLVELLKQMEANEIAIAVVQEAYRRLEAGDDGLQEAISQEIYNDSAMATILLHMPVERVVQELKRRKDIVLLTCWTAESGTIGRSASTLESIRNEMIEIASEAMKFEDVHHMDTAALSLACQAYHGRPLSPADLEVLQAVYAKETTRLEQQVASFVEQVFHARNNDRGDAWSREQIKAELSRLVSQYKQEAENTVALTLCHGIF